MEFKASVSANTPVARYYIIRYNAYVSCSRKSKETGLVLWLESELFNCIHTVKLS